MKCVVSIIVRPVLYDLISSQNFSRLKGSSPDVGSSNMMILESPVKAMPTMRRRFMPPDSFTDCFFKSLPNPTSLAVLNTSASMSLIA